MKEERILNLIGTGLKFDERIRILENFITSDKAGISPSNTSKEKCKCQFNKIDLAHLFYILMDEGILFFDKSDEKNNRARFQAFLEKNFTYSGDEGVQARIKSISRQISECKGYSYKDKQLVFLTGLIEKLYQRKKRLENW